MRFELYNPTRVLFGAGSLSKVGEVVSRVGRRAMVVVGRGSVKENGTLDRALASLKASRVSVAVFEGVEPNPRLSTVRRGARFAKKHKADVVVALGGGSVMDASKVIAAAVFYRGNPWDMIIHGQKKVRFPERALPVVTVPTLAATGSEMNDGAVITNEETTEKSYVTADCLFPRAAVIDPALTLTVPPDQTAYGVADLMTHVTEAYFNGVDGTPVQDRWAEGVLQTALEWGPRAVEDGRDLEARAQIQWASTVALNGFIQTGCDAPFPVHMIEHVLSAHHDIAHGAGLAIVSPAWMRFALRARPERYVLFAERVMGLSAKGPRDLAAARRGIDAYERFLSSLGCPTRLSHVGIGPERIDRYAADAVRVGGWGSRRLGGRPPLTRADVARILRDAA